MKVNTKNGIFENVIKIEFNKDGDKWGLIFVEAENSMWIEYKDVINVEE